MSAATAITIGNFDGVHLGHAELIEAARQAVGGGGKVVVLAFEPHPFTVLRPQFVLSRISTFQQRTKWLKQRGADEVIALAPTRELLSQEPTEFVKWVVDRFAPAVIVEGSDFHFGKGRAGSVQTLHELGKEFGFKTVVVPDCHATLADQSVVRVSSSMIRWLLARGRVRDANLLLGRPYEIVGAVVSGDKRGRAIGFPTANLGNLECMLPADGIYSGAATTPNGSTFAAAISVGTKPTFGEHPRTCEAYLLDYHGPVDDYGWMICLEFHNWLRDQLPYPSVEPLIQQLHRDVGRIRGLADLPQPTRNPLPICRTRPHSPVIRGG